MYGSFEKLFVLSDELVFFLVFKCCWILVVILLFIYGFLVMSAYVYDNKIAFVFCFVIMSVMSLL